MKKAVLISCFNWYEKRLKPIREILIEKGYEVSVLIADFDHIKKTSISCKYAECTYLDVPRYMSNISMQRIRSHLMFAKKVKKWIAANSPDLVYCEVPPNKVVDYCADYKRHHSEIKFIIDIIDLWPESMPLGKFVNTSPANTWRRWRDKAIKVADYVFTECDLYQEKLKGVLDSLKTTTLYLYKEQSEEERRLVQEIISKEKTDDVTRFAYLGSMNNIIDIGGICAVIQSFVAAGNLCELHAIGDGESREKFEGAVRKTGCQTHFYGLIFDELEKIKTLAVCDYAFNIMKNDITVGLTIKSIDYLSYGLPLINNIKGDTWELVEKENIGINTESAEANMYQVDRKHVVDIYRKRFSLEAYINSVNRVLYEDIV
ncbi:MAG: hypothetical protein K6E47_08180 [Lachnospiraceae bacterium]|nr:hypothetical protein [Lachnospiraceae bacterium]